MSYRVTNKYKIKNVRVLKNNTVLEFVFDDYKETDSFPRKLVLKVLADEVLQATIKYSKIEFNKKQEMAFTIPVLYEKIK